VLVGRLYQTAAVTKRLPKPDEVTVSIDGSPVVHSDKSNDAVVMPVNDSQVSLPIFLHYASATISDVVTGGISVHIPLKSGQLNFLWSNNAVRMVIELIPFPVWNFQIRNYKQTLLTEIATGSLYLLGVYCISSS